MLTCRGTKDFEVYTRTSPAGSWRVAASGTLPDPRPLADCQDVPYHYFPLLSRVARYVRFVVASYYGGGGGLQYMEIVP